MGAANRSDRVDLGMAVHCYIIVGFPTEKEEEALETMNFIVENKKLNESYGFSCQPCLFDLEKEAPIMSDPGGYGIRRTMRPSAEDLSLGFFYEVQEGMTPDQAERLYQHVYEKISEVVCELPFNYSMADGLLYIARAKAEERRAVTARNRKRTGSVDRFLCRSVYFSTIVGAFVPATTTTIERITGKLSDQPLLFQYTIKLVLLVAFLELILYRWCPGSACTQQAGRRSSVDHSDLHGSHRSRAVAPERRRDSLVPRLDGRQRQSAVVTRVHRIDPLHRALHCAVAAADDRILFVPRPCSARPSTTPWPWRPSSY